MSYLDFWGETSDSSEWGATASTESW